MAKVHKEKVKHVRKPKRTSQGKGKVKTSSMNKHKRRQRGLALS